MSIAGAEGMQCEPSHWAPSRSSLLGEEDYDSDHVECMRRPTLCTPHTQPDVRAARPARARNWPLRTHPHPPRFRYAAAPRRGVLHTTTDDCGGRPGRPRVRTPHSTSAAQAQPARRIATARLLGQARASHRKHAPTSQPLSCQHAQSFAVRGFAIRGFAVRGFAVRGVGVGGYTALAVPSRARGLHGIVSGRRRRGRRLLPLCSPNSAHLASFGSALFPAQWLGRETTQSVGRRRIAARPCLPPSPPSRPRHARHGVYCIALLGGGCLLLVF